MASIRKLKSVGMQVMAAILVFNRLLKVRFESFSPRNFFEEVLRHFFSNATVDEILASGLQGTELTSSKVA